MKQWFLVFVWICIAISLGYAQEIKNFEDDAPNSNPIKIIYLAKDGQPESQHGIAPKPVDHFRVCAVQPPAIPTKLTGGIQAQQFNWLLKHGLITERSLFEATQISEDQIVKADILGIAKPFGMPESIDWDGMQVNEIISWNIDTAIRILKYASEMDIDIVVFSELYPVPFFPSFAVRDKEILQVFCFDKDVSKHEELSRLIKAGQEYGVTFSIGVPIQEDGKIYNSNLWIHNGEVVHRYNKTNIPGAKLDPQKMNGKYQRFTREYELFTPGSTESEPAVVEIQGKMVMLSSLICHDRRYDATRAMEEIGERVVINELKKKYPDKADIENIPAIVAVPYITPRTIFPPNPQLDARAYRDHYHALEAISMNGALVLASTRAEEDLGTELMGGTAIFSPAFQSSISIDNNRAALIIIDVTFGEQNFASRRAIKWQMNSFNSIPVIKTFLDFQ